jgi:hypothetical protein
MIELSGERTTFPCGGAVARFAALLKLAAMWIAVARCTAIELQADIFGDAASIRNMALLAWRLSMQASERKSGFGVIEVARVFPILRVMALQAIGAELPLMFVVMTRRAGARQS